MITSTYLPCNRAACQPQALHTVRVNLLAVTLARRASIPSPAARAQHCRAQGCEALGDDLLLPSVAGLGPCAPMLVEILMALAVGAVVGAFLLPRPQATKVSCCWSVTKALLRLALTVVQAAPSNPKAADSAHSAVEWQNQREGEWLERRAQGGSCATAAHTGPRPAGLLEEEAVCLPQGLLWRACEQVHTNLQHPLPDVGLCCLLLG